MAVIFNQWTAVFCRGGYAIKTPRRFQTFLLVVAGSTHPAFAVSQAVDVEKEEQVYVQSVRLPSEIDMLGDSVRILTRDVIAEGNHTDVVSLFRDVPGVVVSRPGGAGGAIDFFLRGSESNFATVLINGIPMNDPSNSRGGGFDFGLLDINALERIEIIHGPQSTLYGSDALGGVVNIVTRTGVADNRVSLFAGERGYRGAALNSGLAVGDSGQWGMQATRSRSGEQSPGNEREVNSIFSRYTNTVGDSLAVDGALHYIDSERRAYPELSGGAEFAPQDVLDNADQQSLGLTLGAIHKPTEKSTFNMRYAYLKQQLDLQSPGITPFDNIPPNGSVDNFNRHFLTAHYALARDDFRWNVGMDYKRESANSVGYLFAGDLLLPTRFDYDEDNVGVFSDVHMSFGRIDLSASLRHDKRDGNDGENSARLSAVFQMNDDTFLKLNWGQAFKTPSIYARFHSLTGNPDVRKETSEAYEVSLKHYTLNRRIEFNVSAFWSQYKDLITFDSENFKNVNRDEVDIDGADGSFLWQIHDGFKWGMSATYLDIDLPQGTEPLLGRPPFSFSTFTQWQAGSNLQLQGSLRFVDEQDGVALTTGPKTLDDYSVLDIHVNWDVNAKHRLVFNLDNAFNEAYREAVGVLSPRRTFRVRWDYQF